MSLMSSRSSLMTLMRWLKPSCCCFKCWKQRCAEQGSAPVSLADCRHAIIQSKDASLVWFLGAGLRPRCSAPLISRRQSDSASESETSVRSSDPGGTDDIHFGTICRCPLMNLHADCYLKPLAGFYQIKKQPHTMSDVLKPIRPSFENVFALSQQGKWRQNSYCSSQTNFTLNWVGALSSDWMVSSCTRRCSSSTWIA